MASLLKIVIVCGEGQVEIKRPPKPTDQVIAAVKRKFGVGDGNLFDSDGDLVLDLELIAGDYDYKPAVSCTVAPPDEDDIALSSLIQELHDSLTVLPDLVSVKEFFHKPLPQQIRFPVLEVYYNQLPFQNRSKVFRPVAGFSSFMAYIFALLADVDAQDTEDTFHCAYDKLIKEAVKFFFGKPLLYKRNATSESSLRSLRPDALYSFGHGYILFKGEEKGETTPGEPGEELVAKDAWPYGDSVPYVLAYYTRTFWVTICVLYQVEGRTLKQDLQQFDIRGLTGRVDLFIACAKVAQLVCKLEQICERAGVLPFRKLRRPSGNVLELYPRRVVKTYARDEEAARACAMYSLIGDCPFIAKALHWNAGKRHIVFERGDSRLPLTRQELLDSVRCVLEALVWLHSKNIMHRDLRWPNVVRGGDRVWWIIDFDEAASSPSDGVDHLEQSNHAPEIQGRHDCKVDIWGVGFLLNFFVLSNAMSSGLAELRERCLSFDPASRPTAAECFSFINDMGD